MRRLCSLSRSLFLGGRESSLFPSCLLLLPEQLLLFSGDLGVACPLVLLVRLEHAHDQRLSRHRGLPSRAAPGFHHAPSYGKAQSVTSCQLWVLVPAARQDEDQA